MHTTACNDFQYVHCLSSGVQLCVFPPCMVPSHHWHIMVSIIPQCVVNIMTNFTFAGENMFSSSLFPKLSAAPGSCPGGDYWRAPQPHWRRRHAWIGQDAPGHVVQLRYHQTWNIILPNPNAETQLTMQSPSATCGRWCIDHPRVLRMELLPCGYVSRTNTASAGMGRFHCKEREFLNKTVQHHMRSKIFNRYLLTPPIARPECKHAALQKHMIKIKKNNNEAQGAEPPISEYEMRNSHSKVEASLVIECKPRNNRGHSVEFSSWMAIT